MISFDRIVDVMYLNKIYIISIFMNINENLKNQEKLGENILPLKYFGAGNMIYLALLDTFLWRPVLSEEY